jgi:hypothetical protein
LEVAHLHWGWLALPVSILLGQWIALEAVGAANALIQRRLDINIKYSFLFFTICQRAFLHDFLTIFRKDNVLIYSKFKVVFERLENKL